MISYINKKLRSKRQCLIIIMNSISESSSNVTDPIYEKIIYTATVGHINHTLYKT